jgi:hypothetical protein
MNEIDNQILASGGIEPTIQQPQVQTDVVPPVPQIDVAELQSKMDEMYHNQIAMARALQEARAQQPQAQAKSLTPDEEIAADVRKKLGIDELSEQMKAIKAHNESLMAREAAQQQQQYVSGLVQKYGEQSIQSVEAELKQLARVNPELASSLNTPQGVEYLLSKYQAQAPAQRQPDAVIPSGNNGLPAGNQAAFNNIASGTFGDEDIFAALSAHMK